MSRRVADAGAYLRWLVASEYFDGAMAGIGERAVDGATVWFRVVAWDDEQWQRVFAVSTIEPSLSEQLVRNLEKAEPRKVPFWLPSVQSVTPETVANWGEIVETAVRSETWRLVEAHDLNEPSVERVVGPSDVSRVVAVLRAESVFAASGSSLTDKFLQQIRSQAG